MGKLPFEKRKPKLLIRDKNIKIHKFKLPSAQELFERGVVNLDKPAPMLSKAASRKVKGILEIWKAGHAGTLDPAVTGVLPIFIARGRKMTSVVSIAGKEYHCWMRVHEPVSKEKIEDALKKFTGKIKQVPPKISAVKRVERIREIYYIELLKIERNTVEFIVGCQAGTYIRKLCHDIGIYLGVGAHMAKLIRTKAGPFKLKDSVNLDDVVNNYKKYLETKEDKFIYQIIKPLEDAVEPLSKIWIDDEVIPRLEHGSPIFTPGIVQAEDDIKVGDLVACMTTKSRLASLGIAEMDSKQMIKEKKGLAVKTSIVML